MRITNSEKLKMVKEHISDGKSLSHISERYGNYDTARIKYFVNLYKRFGEKPFINRVKDGESIICKIIGLPNLLKASTAINTFESFTIYP